MVVRPLTTVQVSFLTFVSVTLLLRQPCWWQHNLDVSDETSFLFLTSVSKPNQTTDGWCFYWVRGWNEHLKCLPPASNQTSTCHIKHLVDGCFKPPAGSWWEDVAWRRRENHRHRWSPVSQVRDEEMGQQRCQWNVCCPDACGNSQFVLCINILMGIKRFLM